jgi:hypothetical protein
MTWEEYAEQVQALAALPTEQAVDAKLARDAWARDVGELVLTTYEAGKKVDGRERADLWFRSLMTFVEQIMSPELPIPEFHRWWYWWLITEQFYLNLSPMGHAKSTIHAVWYPLWRIVCDKNVRIIVGSETSTQASIRTDACRTQLDSNPLLVAAFGNLNPAKIPQEQRLTPKEKWIAAEFVVNRSNYALADPTMRSVGVYGATLGARCDIGIGDDVVGPRNCNTTAATAKTMSWLDSDFMSRVEPGGQFLLVGTLQKYDDPYQRIRQEKKDVFRIFVSDAVQKEGPEGQIEETLWEDKFPPVELEMRRAAAGAIAFNRSYRNRVQSEETQVFPDVFFTGGVYDKLPVPGCYDRNLTYSNLYTMTGGYDLLTVIGIDPDIADDAKAGRMGRGRESRRENYFGAVALGYVRSAGLSVPRGHVVVLHVGRALLNWSRQKAEVYRLYNRYSPRLVVVEKNHYQAALAAQAGEDYPTIPILPVFTGINKIDPDVGVEAMQPHFQNGLFLLPYGDRYSKRLSEQLSIEFTKWPLWPTSDLLMAFWLAWVRLEMLIRRYSAIRQLRKMSRPGGRSATQKMLEEYDQARRGRLPVRARRGPRMAHRGKISRR